jgi:exodeoxyribonuclease VII large subunit
MAIKDWRTGGKRYEDLSSFLTRLKDGIESLALGKVWLRAEISSMKISGGHCYLELSQNEGKGLVAKARAIIWRSVFPSLSSFFYTVTGSGIRTGIQVLVLAEVSFSQLYGMSLIISDIDPQFTIGEKELERRRTIEKLSGEGLLDLQKKLAPYAVPRRLAIVSAGDAAGYGDFMDHLHKNEYGFVFYTRLFKAVMQGASAPVSIISAIKEAEDASCDFDALLILRGGGSPLDLACYDDYDMAAAIARCRLPVYTAIGHERDFHVADMAAFEYVKTPTALADEFINICMSEDQSILDLWTRIASASVKRLEVADNDLNIALLKITHGVREKINSASSVLDLLEAGIKASDPVRLLAGGYALALDAGGLRIKSASGCNPGDKVSLMFSDGIIDCEIKKVNLKSNKKKNGQE